MSQSNLLQSLLNSKAPKNMRLLAAQGLAPLSPNEMLELLVQLLGDEEQDVVALAEQTLNGWPEEEVIVELQKPQCSSSVLAHFASKSTSPSVLEAIILNQATAGKVIAALASTVQADLLETILYNKVRVFKSPEILDNIKLNPSITPEIQRLVMEIEADFFSDKKSVYSVEKPVESKPTPEQYLELEAEVPAEDLSLEGLPIDPEERETAIAKRLSSMPVREKIRHALFGNREIRTMLIRDSNKEVARSVLLSPKISESEVESISAMRSIAEDILREIGNSKKWVKSYNIVQNLVKNPKTPPIISQRLLFRLRSQDLSLLVRDRAIPETVRHNATRTLSQRSAARSSQ